MKVIKDKHQSLLFKTFGLAGRTHLSLAVLLFFDLERPDPVLTEQELWSEISKVLGPGESLDQGMPKARGEFLVHGTCHAQAGKAVEAASAAVQVGQAYKRLLVFGDRHWNKGRPTKPIPFTEMPIVWDRAFGGPHFERNPKGKGHNLILMSDGRTILPLPNIEVPEHLVLDPDSRPDPAGFGMIAPTWLQQRKKEGTYDTKWKEQVMPDLPEDTAEDLFNVALPDQQIQGFFQPGDPVTIEHMHPRIQVIRSTLPQVRLRVFLTRKKSLKPEERHELLFEEIENKIDTVWLFPGLLRGVVMYRGVTSILDDEYADVVRIYLASEDALEEPRTMAYYQEEEKKRLDRSVPMDPAPFEAAADAVASALLRVQAIPKLLKEARNKALGQAPTPKTTPLDMARVKNKIIERSQTNLSRLETQARLAQARQGHRLKVDLSRFEKLKAKLNQASQEIDQALAKTAELKAEAEQTKKKVGQQIKETISAEKLAEAGIDPDNLLALKPSSPWIGRGFPLVSQWRNRMSWSDDLREKLLAMGLTSRTIRRAWLGELSPAFSDDPSLWGLENGPPLDLPSGLVIPWFKGPNLTRIRIRPGDLTDSGQDMLVPGSGEEPRSYLLDHEAPVVRVADELEAVLLEQEAGDAVHIVALADEDVAPGNRTKEAIETAEIFLVVVPEHTTEKDPAWAPWLKKYPKARLMALPEGNNLFEARAKGLDIREWILTALPRPVQDEHRVKSDLSPVPPTMGSPLAGLVIPGLDVGDLVRTFSREIKAGFQPQIRAAQAKKEELQALMGKTAAEAGATLPSDFPELSGKSIIQQGEDITRQLRETKESYKTRGRLTPELEQHLDQEADKATQMTRKAAQQFENGKNKLQAAIEKAASAKTRVQARQPSETMKKRFEASGLEMPDLTKLTRDEVVQRLARGRSLAGTNLEGLDLSSLDFSGRDLSGCQCRKTDFQEANLSGTNLERVIAGEADFSRADLSGARLIRAVCTKASFIQANLTGAGLSQAVFREADLTQAVLTHAELHQTILEKAVLLATDFSESSVLMVVLAGAQAMGSSFQGARLQKSLFQKTRLDQADFSDARLIGCLFQKAVGEEVVLARVRMNRCGIMESDFPQVDFSGADLSGSFFKDNGFAAAGLSRSVLTGALFDACDLSGADLTGALAQKTRLVRCNLEKARLVAVNLCQGSLRKSRLVKTDLKGSNLYGVDFYKAEVGDTGFHLANLKNTPLFDRTHLL